jgi:hypothetical protein
MTARIPPAHAVARPRAVLRAPVLPRVRVVPHVQAPHRALVGVHARVCRRARAGELRRHHRAAVLLALLVLLAGCATPHATGPTSRTPAVTDLAVVPLAAMPQTPELPAAPPLRPVARLAGSTPVRLDVPAIGLRAGRVTDLGVDGGGVLLAPPDAATAGWSILGPTPGAAGPAVITAHLELDGVPGLFARLPELTPGAEVGVHRADGTEAVFVAYRVERFGKTAFPADDVYGDTAGPELRLITSGGVFDRGDGRFVDNVVVYARLVGAR